MGTLIKLGKIKNLGLVIGGGLFIAAPITILAAPTPSVTAPNGCVDWIAKVVSTEGRVETRLTAETAWQTVTLNQTLCPGSMVHTQAHSRAALLLRNNTLLRLTQKSTLTLPAAQPDKPFWLELLDGAINVITRTPKKFQVDTPFVNAAVDGTEFFVKIAENKTTVSVFEGRVIAENPSGRVTLHRGEATTASAGQAPATSIPVNPSEQRQAVHWALHYPPILSYRADDFKEGDEASWQARVRKSIAYTQAGDTQNALASVIDTPQDAAAAFFGYRASLLLNVGRVNEANADIKTALNIAPNDGIALALQSVIAVAQNQHEAALTLAQQATVQAPQVAGSWMALSYAQQANFNLPEAINAAQRGADSEPNNALAWARIAELHLMTGNLDGALAAASKATTLNPNLARTQSVLGFVYLTQIKTKHARQAFEQAITLDQADPLPRLGLGLAKIRDGDLAAGREDIEIATALDPNNALVRSYMGKAYYEERRDPLAASQFDIAKTLDPKDPTPWFYDAILKQSTNRPVEALQDLQKSIELNDNRAVYRSRLLLDQDQAARNASQARIYNDMGLQQLALTHGWKSLNTDPANYSAHRFLADAYTTQPRHETARVSELLQAQLLQPININPVQPQQAETALNILSGAGPASPSANEFNPLFQRDQFRLQVSGMGGANNTWGNELVHSSLIKNVSYSLGQFAYDTNGFRPNNDLRHNIYNAFIQATLSPKVSVQFEYKSRKTENGDIALRFDPTNFSTLDRSRFDTRTQRLGFRYLPTTDSTFIASVIHNNRQENQNLFFPGGPTINPLSDVSGYTAEVQYLLNRGRHNVVIGMDRYDGTRNTNTTQDFTAILGEPCPAYISPCDEKSQSDVRHDNAYVYTHIRYPSQLTWTLGASYDDFQETPITRRQFNPKLGMTWSLASHTTLRLAAFRALKRPLASSQTIEPTQIAGFNQFFDDYNGTQSRRYGLGIDQQFSETLFVGIELSIRKLDVPTNKSVTTFVVEKHHEKLHRVYLNWIPTSRTTVNLEYFIEDFDKDFRPTFENGKPSRLDTQRIPISIIHFHPSGFFFKGSANYITQKIELPLLLGGASSDQSAFWVMDASAGYRLPKRLGIISLDAKNLLDKQFKYQNLNFQTSEPKDLLFQPGSAIYARFTLAL